MVSVVKAVHAAKDGHRPTFEALSESEVPEIREAVDFLSSLVAKSFTEPLGVVLATLIERMGVDKYTEY